MDARTPAETRTARGEKTESASLRRMPSLKVRLLAISLALLVFSLLVTGTVLVLLFRVQAQRHFDQTLTDHLHELAAAIQVQPDGAVKLTWEPADPRFRLPRSNWYWEVRQGNETVRRSPSLGKETLAVTTPPPARDYVYHFIPGPGRDVRLRIRADIVEPLSVQPVTVLVAGPRMVVRRDVLAFVGQLAVALGVLALLLGTMIVLQVTVGLRPLAQMQAALAGVRAGRHARLDASGPAEVAPLIDELNGLLGEREAAVEAARAEAGDLAHSLKTPIAVISNEVRELPEEQGAVLRAELDRMARVVEHHLVRARTKARQRLPGPRARLDEVMEDVRFSLSRLYPERKLQLDIAPGLVFAGEADDLGEMTGNLADNACKWAAGVVRISATREAGRIRLVVEDDGPGLDEDACAQALARGERLGSSMPGHGLGLPIVAQLAELYGGTLRLGRSPLGGVSAILDLPAVDGAAA